MTMKQSNLSSSKAFQRDLQVGQQLEVKVLKSIQKKYPSAVLIPGKFKPYDIFIPETGDKVEVKADYKSLETNNILIELKMFNKPSALLSTEADYWVFYTGKEIMWTTPILIMECIMINNIQSIDILGEGDAELKRACLVPINLFREYLLKD